MGPGVAGCVVGMWGCRDLLPGPQTMTSDVQGQEIPEDDPVGELGAELHSARQDQGSTSHKEGAASNLYVWSAGGQVQQLPRKHRCGGVGGGPCQPEPTSSWPPHSAVASLGIAPGLGRFGNELETPPPCTAAASRALPDPRPGGDPGQ